MDTIIDQALLEAAAITQVSQPPAIIRPFFDASASFKALRAENERQLTWLSSEVDRVALETNSSLKELNDLFSKHELVPRHFVVMDHLISLIENRVDKNASSMKKHSKEMARMVKQCKNLGPDFVDGLREDFNKALALMEKEIELTLAFADGLRALRAKHDPSNKVVATFLTSGEMEAHFQKLMNG